MRDLSLQRLLPAVFGVGLLASPASLRAQHDHAGHQGHASTPVDCRALAAPPWTGLPASDRAMIDRLVRSAGTLNRTDAASAAGFTPQFGDIPTMGVHWISRNRMQDAVQADAPDHLLFTRIAGRDSLVGVAFAFRGPTDATMPALFESPLAAWHDHPGLGGGSGNTLHMLHVWFVPSPYGPFAGNNFFLPLMAAGRALPNPCWIQTEAEVTRFELVATLVDVLHRRTDSTTGREGRGLARGRPGAQRAWPAVLNAADALARRITPHLTTLDSAARVADRDRWEQAADAILVELRPGERRLVETLRDRLKGMQASTTEQGRRRKHGRPQ
ncbi:hypothetical protein [Gemmatimonas sp.]|jgi:hypothetical protein|uniref:hypothetical protein n=1 Tax=Gemmatimonas sp. TaxID=1962908 RepID=UPI0022C0890F|nr:hypothetical protein [Gemmatimonas sp.]MCZ8203387.1 hypothetical protein [Gemmatimonas sp.]